MGGLLKLRLALFKVVLRLLKLDFERLYSTFVFSSLALRLNKFLKASIVLTLQAVVGLGKLADL